MMARHWVTIGKAALSAAIIAWLLRSLDYRQLLEAVGRLSAAALAAAAGCFVLQAAVVAWRWQRIVQRLGGQLPLRNAIDLVFAGIFFNQLLPTSVGGDVVRVVGLHRLGTASGAAFHSVAIERLSGVTALGLMITACLPAMWSDLPSALRVPLALCGPGLLLLTAALAFVDRLPRAILARPLRQPATDLATALRGVGSRARDLGELAVLGVAAQLGVVVPAWVLGHALGIDQPLAVYVVAVGGAILLSALPISLGGWGVREATLVGLFGLAGASAESVITLSLVWALLPALISVPSGLLWWRTMRGRPRDRVDPTEAPVRGDGPGSS